MKRYTVYICETCGYEHKNFKKMTEHEAAHKTLNPQVLDMNTVPDITKSRKGKYHERKYDKI